MHEFLAISIIMILALISPRPDFIITVKQSLSQGGKAGIITAFGIAAGLMFHSLYCLLGLSLIVSSSTFLFNIIKYLGAIYLIYLGIQTIKSKGFDFNKIKEERTLRYKTFVENFQTGFLTNVLNPKAMLFMISLFSFIIKEETVVFAKVFYALWMFILTALWFSFIAVWFSNKYIKSFFVKSGIYVDKFLGSILIFFGIKLALMVH